MWVHHLDHKIFIMQTADIINREGTVDADVSSDYYFEFLGLITQINHFLETNNKIGRETTIKDQGHKIHQLTMLNLRVKMLKKRKSHCHKIFQVKKTGHWKKQRWHCQ
jgi:5-enolpyruvylshikimate-3-phosphate synthase